MANIPLKSIKFPGLSDTYIVPQIDDTLTTAGKAADAKKTGDELSDLKSAVDEIDTAVFGERQHIEYVEGEYVANGGEFTTFATWSRTNYLDCTGLNSITYKNTGIATAYNAFYDANKDYISMFNIEIRDSGNVTVPASAKYFVISQKTTDIRAIEWTNMPSGEGGITNDIIALDGRLDTAEDEIDAINEKIVTSPNILDLDNGWLNNKYINKNTGELANYSGWKACETYIPIDPNKTYTLIYYDGTAWSDNSSTHYAFYNSSKEYTHGAILSTNNPTTSQTGDAYIRVSMSNAVYSGKPMFGLASDLSDISGDITAYTAPGTMLVGNANDEKIAQINTRLDDIDSLPVIVLPAKAYAVEDTQFNIYTRNVVVAKDYDAYAYMWTVTPYTMTYDVYSECLRFTPAAADAGDYTITLLVKDRRTWTTLASKTMSLTVLAKSTLTGKKVVFIGDSLTNNGAYVYEVQNLSSSGVTSIGTVTSTPWIGNVQQTVTHEGRGGWSINDYVTKASKSTVTNAFWNPSTSKFDFAYWLSNNSFSMPDLVFINLGTNGAGDIEDNINGIDEMITSIRASSATVPILISLITPPATQDGWTYVNHGGSAGSFEKMQMALNQRYIEEYDGKESQHIYLSPVYFNLDRYHDYGTTEAAVSARNPALVTRQTNNVHPSYYGQLKLADVYWEMIQKLLS